MDKLLTLAARTAGAVLMIITRGRIITRTAARDLAIARQTWREHAASIQAQLDAERARGFGFKYIDGRRIDF